MPLFTCELAPLGEIRLPTMKLLTSGKWKPAQIGKFFRTRISLTVALPVLVTGSWLPPSANSSIFWPLIAVSLIVGAFAIALSTPQNWLSLGFILYATTSLFNLGLLPLMWLGITDSYGFADYVATWLDQPLGEMAARYSSTLLLTFALGYSTTALLSERQVQVITPILGKLTNLEKPVSKSQLKRAEQVGGGVELILPSVKIFASIALAMWGSAQIFTNNVLLSGYWTFLEESNFEHSAWGPFLLLASVAIATTCQRTLWLVVPLTIDVATLLILGITGSRSILILTLVSTLVVLAKFRARCLPKFSLLLIPAMLCAVAALRMVRDGLRFTWESLVPFNSIYEMGSSLRPLVETIRLHQNGQFDRDLDFINGFGLWLMRKLSLVTGPAQSSDYYGFGPQLMHEQFGPEHRFGWSMLAEIYIDFSLPLALTIVIAASVVIFMVDRIWLGTDLGALLSLAFCVPLIFAVRQPVTQIIPHFIAFAMIGLGLLAISSVIRTVIRSQRGRRDYSHHKSQEGYRIEDCE